MANAMAIENKDRAAAPGRFNDRSTMRPEGCFQHMLGPAIRLRSQHRAQSRTPNQPDANSIHNTQVVDRARHIVNEGNGLESSKTPKIHPIDFPPV